MDEEPPAKLSEVTDDVIGAAVEVHDRLGPGLLERACEEALSAELDRRGNRLPVPGPPTLAPRF
ncbi:hypothetical protein BRD56_09135 [Thermoplasmatales archaeon SW_10_69_26]|nr:MAG: hypothetical protein BRD56_09135 [Thermoplasmatales archaeon SW_10_69_26]